MQAFAHIVLTHTAVAGSWVLLSDIAFAQWAANGVVTAPLLVAKAVTWMCIGALLLTVLLKQEFNRREREYAALRDSESRNRQLFDASPLPMWVYHRVTLRILEANDAAIRRFGWRRDELHSMSLADLHPLDDLPRLRAQAANLDGQAFSAPGIVRLRDHAGAEIEVDLRQVPLRLGEDDAVLALGRDVTELQRLRLALAASEQRLRDTFEYAAIGVARVAPDGRWLDVNRHLCRILERERRELLGARMQDAAYPDDAARDANLLAQASAEASGASAELRLQRPSGAEVWVRKSVAALPTADGAPAELVVVIDDISRRRHAEEELRKVLRAVEQSTEAVAITDRQSQIEFVNDAFVRVSGYSREELIGRNPRILQSGRTPRSTYDVMWRTLAQGLPWCGEFVNRRKDGSEYVEIARLSPVRDDAGDITHYVAVKEDITEQRCVADELEHHRHHLEELVTERTAELERARLQADAANHAKSAFLAHMSHEIRTPMNGVLGTLDVLACSTLTARQRELLQVAQQSGRTMLGIVDDILDFSRIESGYLRIDPAPLCLADEVESLAEAMAPVARHRAVDLMLFVDPLLPQRVLSDGLRLRQILFNLVGNAIKFSAGRPERRGRVTLRATQAASTPAELHIAVNDNGIGIPAQALPGLFAPFNQADTSITRRYGGSGLGLSISQRLSQMLDGRIDVVSEIDVGSTFTLVLRCHVLDADPAPPAHDLAGTRCLLIDTPELDTPSLTAYLQHCGAKVEIAAVAPQRMPHASEGSPLVLIDTVLAADDAAQSTQCLLRLRRVDGTSGLDCDELQIPRTALRHAAFVRAVATVAGRLPPSTVDSPGFVAAPALPTPETGSARVRLLVAEDDEINRLVVRSQLELLGYAAEVVNDGEQALERWQRGSYTLLLTDMHMPTLDGHGLARAIRALETKRADGQRTPIIALTAEAAAGLSEDDQAAGIDCRLNKPLQIDALRATLERWLSKAGHRSRVT
jgi:PAS domain S-box-containing protein